MKLIRPSLSMTSVGIIKINHCKFQVVRRLCTGMPTEKSHAKLHKCARAILNQNNIYITYSALKINILRQREPSLKFSRFRI